MNRSDYIGHLNEVLLPFWMRALDHEYGGLFTCYSNSGDELLSEDKYTWSQGRFLWLWARLASRMAEGRLEGDPDSYRAHLLKSADFLESSVFLENGHCAYLLDRTGKKLESEKGKGFDTSIYADCFVVIGLAETARFTRDRQRLDRATTLYRSIRQRLSSGEYRTEPYPIPPGYKPHSIPMIMLNVSQTMANSGRALDMEWADRIQKQAVDYMDEIFSHFIREDGRMIEMYSDDPGLRQTLLGRHFNPGHSLESIWFLIETAQASGQEERLQELFDVVETAIELGWDNRYGGLFRFTDCEGGEPSGKSGTGAYEQLILDTWDTKLWWPHSEAVYTTLLTSRLSGNKRLQKWHEQIRDYTFSTFPNPDKRVGEWIQIRNRAGRPLSRVVALPVKDPFHIIRNILLIIDLLESDETDERNQ